MSDGVETYLQELGREIEQLDDRIAVLSAMRARVEASDDETFTRRELQAIKKALEEATQNRTRKHKQFREKVDIYENRVQRLSRVLDKRSNVLNGLCAETSIVQHEDLMDIFATEHDSLRTELQKSQTLLNPRADVDE